MIQDDDDIVLSKGDETIREYTVANLIYEFIKGGNFVWSQFQNANSDSNFVPQLNILYDGEALCTVVNLDIVDRINEMAKKLPHELKIFYDYSVYESEYSKQSISFKVPVRSGFNVTIRSKSDADSDNNFYLKFKLSSERTSDAVHYDGRFYMRFVEVSELTKRIVNQIIHLINCEKDNNDTE